MIIIVIIMMTSDVFGLSPVVCELSPAIGWKVLGRMLESNAVHDLLESIHATLESVMMHAVPGTTVRRGYMLCSK